MDTSVTYIGIAIALVVMLPLYFGFRAQLKNRAKIKNLLSQHNCQFSEVESKNNKLLALDPTSKKWLIIPNINEPASYLIDLNPVKSCNVSIAKQGELTSSVGFDVIYKNTSENAIIPYYHVDQDLIGQIWLHEDRTTAQKWTDRINELIA